MPTIKTNSNYSAVSIGVEVAIDSDVQTYINAVGDNMYEEDVNTFILSLKNAGIYSKLDKILIPAISSDLTKGLINIKTATNQTSGGSSASYKSGLGLSLSAATTPLVLATGYSSTAIYTAFGFTQYVSSANQNLGFLGWLTGQNYPWLGYAFSNYMYYAPCVVTASSWTNVNAKNYALNSMSISTISVPRVSQQGRTDSKIYTYSSSMSTAYQTAAVTSTNVAAVTGDFVLGYKTFSSSAPNSMPWGHDDYVYGIILIGSQEMSSSEMAIIENSINLLLSAIIS